MAGCFFPALNMLKNKFQAVLEGAHPDTPHLIEYCPFNIPLSENATVLLVTSARLVLYGRLTTPRDVNTFQMVIRPDDSIRGIKIFDPSTPSNRDWINWIFEMPRSISTIDGRFYLSDIFFKPNWTYYFPLIKPILQDCNDFYSKRISENQLRSLERRTF